MPFDARTDALEAQLRSDAIALSRISTPPVPHLQDLRRRRSVQRIPLIAGAAASVAIAILVLKSPSTPPVTAEQPVSAPMFASLADLTALSPQKDLINSALLPAETDLEHEVEQMASDIAKIRSQLASGWSRISERGLKGQVQT